MSKKRLEKIADYDEKIAQIKNLQKQERQKHNKEERAAKRYALCDEFYSLKEEIPNMEAIRRRIEGLMKDEPQRIKKHDIAL